MNKAQFMFNNQPKNNPNYAFHSRKCLQITVKVLYLAVHSNAFNEMLSTSLNARHIFEKYYYINYEITFNEINDVDNVQIYHLIIKMVS